MSRCHGALAVVLAALIGPAPAVAAPGLDSTNFVDVGDSVTDMLDTNALSFATMMMMGSAAIDAARPRPVGFRPPNTAVAPQTFSSPCPNGGQLRTTVVDADADGELSAGDRFATQFESCAIAGDVMTGRSEFVVAAHRFEGNNEITELDFRFKDLGSAAMRWNGAARAALRSDLQRGTEGFVATYLDLAVSRGPHRMRWSFSLDVVRPPFGNALATLAGTMRIDGLQVRLRQDEPFALAGDGFPREGQLTLSDDEGASLQVEAGRRRYTYRLYRAGRANPERPEATSQSRPYGAH
jgi:hypothetical protein